MVIRAKHLLLGFLVTCLFAFLTLPPVAAADRIACLGRKATIVGKDGKDKLKGTGKDDVIFAGGGNDIVFGGGGDDRICGGAGDDKLYGEGGTDAISGDEDQDVLIPGPGNDRALGGPGRDTISFVKSSDDVRVDIAGGKAIGDGLDRFALIENAVGGSGNDLMRGSEDRNRLEGGPGNDSIESGPAFDIVSGGPGNDEIDAGGDRDVLYLFKSKTAVNVDLTNGTSTGEGSDTFSNVEAVYDSPKNDTITGTSGTDFFIAGPGNDVIDAGDGLDMVLYWFAEAPVTVDLGKSTASGGLGSDTLTSVEGAWGSFDEANKLVGNDANNLLFGGTADDELIGNGGDDRLKGYEGDDVYDGGDGTFDKVDLSDVEAGVDANLATGTAEGAGSDTLVGIEALLGTQFNDILTGDGFTNYLGGGPGDDNLVGGDGEDWLGGADGNDTLDGGPGPDHCRFGETVTSCEGAEEPPEYPEEEESELVIEFQRSF